MLIEWEYTEDMLYKDYKIQKRKNGLFSCDVLTGRDSDSGKYIYKTLYAPDRNQLRKKRADFIRQKIQEQKDHAAHMALLSTAMEVWLFEVKYGTIKRDSFDRLEQVYRCQIKPVIGDAQTKTVTRQTLKSILDVNLYKGYSYSTLLKIYRFLKEFFTYLENAGIIEKSPMLLVPMYRKDFVLETQQQIFQQREQIRERIDRDEEITDEELQLASSGLKMHDRTEMRILTDEEISRMKATAELQDKDGNPIAKQGKFFLFMLNTGIREGEACALRYSDINFKNETMTIRGNMVVERKRDLNGQLTGGSQNIITTPKTTHSRTTVPINQTALNLIRRMNAEEEEGYNGFIANNQGKSMSKWSFERYWRRFLKLAEVTPCGMHTLRHTFASKLYEKTDGDSKLVSELIRHSSVSFTEETYIHLEEKYKSKMIEDFEI